MAARFGVDGRLVGVVTLPESRVDPSLDAQSYPPDAASDRADRAGVVFLNAGLIHRVGPNRVYVRMARLLAGHGLGSVRFDLSGVGDSPAGNDPDVLRRWVAETRSVMDQLERQLGVTRFILVGNCSGAGLAFLTARQDPRVHAAALVNPQPQRNTRYYLRLARSHPNFWRRLSRGRSRYALAVGRITRRGIPYNADAAGSADRDLHALLRRGCRILLVSCEWDASFDGFYRPLQRQANRGELEGMDLALVPGANHDFSTVASQDRLVEAVCGWVTTVAGIAAPD